MDAVGRCAVSEFIRGDAEGSAMAASLRSSLSNLKLQHTPAPLAGRCGAAVASGMNLAERT